MFNESRLYVFNNDCRACLQLTVATDSWCFHSVVCWPWTGLYVHRVICLFVRDYLQTNTGSYVFPAANSVVPGITEQSDPQSHCFYYSFISVCRVACRWSVFWLLST